MTPPRQIGKLLVAVAVLLLLSAIGLAVVVNNRLDRVERAQATADTATDRITVVKKKQTTLTKFIEGEDGKLGGVGPPGTIGPRGPAGAFGDLGPMG